jgi:hypothetical protein
MLWLPHTWLGYCTSGWCHHSTVMNADWLPDDMPLRSLCSRMVCTACGLIGADVRPDCHRTRMDGRRKVRVAIPVGRATRRTYQPDTVARCRA